MLDFLYEYGLFLAKVVTFCVAAVVVIGFLVMAGQNRRQLSKAGHIEVRNLNEEFEDMTDTLDHAMMDKFQFKQLRKSQEKADKLQTKQDKADAKKQAKQIKAEGSSGLGEEALPATKKRTFVLDFDGDVKASAVEFLRHEISAIISVAKVTDEIIMRLDSSGGMVHTYGLAASQLGRINTANIPLTICVDQIAASGGYMMACMANHITAAPFALVGSIGVVAEVPNVHRLLKKHSIDVEVLTAGEHKRSLTIMGENTRKGRDKFVEDLQQTHGLFKSWVKQQRPQLDLEQVANGDVWYGQQAIDLGLVDAVGTSDEVLQQAVKDSDVLLIEYVAKKTMGEKFGIAAATSLSLFSNRIWSKARRHSITH
ncbi:protease SohB [Candidatus Njordibacter sp. Uisw_056]|uniref:protease SohB n=1 Tax=Candidatus Njordibacter sp. Uisw_056 TaxID=3230973 RepID=UPI003D583A07